MKIGREWIAARSGYLARDRNSRGIYLCNVPVNDDSIPRPEQDIVDRITIKSCFQIHRGDFHLTSSGILKHLGVVKFSIRTQAARKLNRIAQMDLTICAIGAWS